MMFLDCPAYLDQDGAARCGLPAEVTRRFVMRSTDGPLESAMIRCPAGHWFNGPIEFLTWDSTDKRDPGTAAVAPRARRDNPAGDHDNLDRSGRPALQEIPAEPERGIRRPISAPAYYLGRPARLWIAAMRPGGRRTVSDHPPDGRCHPGTPASAADGRRASVSQTERTREPERTAMPVPERRSA